MRHSGYESTIFCRARFVMSADIEAMSTVLVTRIPDRWWCGDLSGGLAVIFEYLD
jgi:hypothetical protein